MVGYAKAETAWPLAGLVTGVAVAAALSYGMYRGAHPQHHGGDDGDRDQRGHSGNGFRAQIADGVAAKMDRQEDDQCHRDGTGHTEPHPAQRIAAVGLHQERDQDHHDDPAFESFAQSDETATEVLREACRPVG
ncbi:putative iron permease FTR1 [Mycobacteroides abscessus subsp. abscessus]|nr:putative iron permease FTR1 [Mycobacteroides abscessus subsp. abscessus]